MRHIPAERARVGRVCVPAGSTQPIRTCVGCRRRAHRDRLARFVLRGERATYDPTGSALGRGAWIHRRQACWHAAQRQGGFAHALRARIAQCDALPGGDIDEVEASMAVTEESGLEADGHPMSTQR